MRGSQAQIRAKILRHVERWKPIIGLSHWEVEVLFDEKEHTATSRAQPEYRVVSVNFSLPRIQSIAMTERGLEELVVHELCHAVVWTLARGFEKNTPTPITQYFEEETTSTIAFALMRARYD